MNEGPEELRATLIGGGGVSGSFARNSPEGVSGFEIRSLIFRGFQAIGE